MLPLLGGTAALALVALGMSSRRHLMVHLFLAAFLLGPRIPLQRLGDFQRADIRPDDLVLFLMTVSAAILVVSGRVRVRYPGFFLLYVFYFLWSSLSTAIAALTSGSGVLLLAVFLLRVIEFSMLMFIVPVFIVDARNLHAFFKTYSLLVVANLLWVAYQLVSREKGPLVELIQVASYGYSSIGETHPLAVGAVFSFAFIVFSSYFLLMEKRMIFLLLAGSALTATVFTLSRSNIIAILVLLSSVTVALVVMAVGRRLSWKGLVTITLLYVLGAWVLFYLFATADIRGLPGRRLEADQVNRALTSQRLETIWLPGLTYFLDRPILGHGVGSLDEVLRFTDEAHNYFLRVLLESGLVGLLFYLGFTLAVFRYAVRMALGGTERENRCIAFVTTFWIIAALTMCIGQDALLSGKIAVPYYFLIGVLVFIGGRKPRVETPGAAGTDPGRRPTR